MVYEIRVKKWGKAGSISLEKYYGNKENADRDCKALNDMLDMYFVNEIKLEDEEIKVK